MRINWNKRIVIFGAGVMGKLLVRLCKLNKCKDVVVVDNSKSKWGRRLLGKRIYSPDILEDTDIDSVYLIGSVHDYKEITEQLLSYGINEQRIHIFSDKRAIEYEIMKKKGINILKETKFLILDRPTYMTATYYFRRIKNVFLQIYYKIALCLFRPNVQEEKKYDVSLCAIFRDEADYIKEWIEFHMLVGVEHFYLYNNFSKDGYFEVLREYIEKDIVTLTDWPVKQGQMQAYQDCVDRFSNETKWIGFFDIDEYCVPNHYEKIYDLLRSFNNRAPIVLVNWRYFGTSGIIKRDPGKTLIIEDFVVAWRKYSDIGKFFYNTLYEYCPSKKHGEFMHYMWAKYNKIWLPPVNVYGQVCLGDYFPMKNGSLPMQLNHYVLKSYSEYFEKKAKRGGGVHGIEMHNEEYFFEHEAYCQCVDYNAYKYLMRLKKNLNIL